MALIAHLGGLAWDARYYGWSTLFASLIVILLAYVLAFYLWETKHPWIIAGLFALAMNVIVTLAQTGIASEGWLQKLEIASVEWFVVAAIAGLITMLIPKPASVT